MFIADIGTLRLLPEHDVMLEEHRVALGSASSATGTISPSIWQVELENRNSVMSRSRGASVQPESETTFSLSSGAPQVPQLVRSASF